MIRKYIIFSFIGLALTAPLQVQAKDSLFSFGKPSSKTGESSTTDAKKPGLCPQHYPLGAPIVNSAEKDKIARRSFYLFLHYLLLLSVRIISNLIL